MKTLSLVCVVWGVIVLSTAAMAGEPPDSLWSRTFGGSNEEECNSVQQTTDGGYILVGFTSSYGAGLTDVWLVKVNANGDTLWTRTFGGSDYDGGNSVQQTSDGGYILGGSNSSYAPGGGDFWLLKVNANGDTLWTRTYGGSAPDECYSVQQTTDGGYVLAGRTCSYGAGADDFWLVRTDANGDTLWTRTFGGSSSDYCRSVQQTSDGGYILGGWTQSYGAGSRDFWLVKTDSNGDSLWSRTFGGSSQDECNSVQQTTDGGYVLGGRTDSYGAGGRDFWLVKTDSNGDTLWTRTYGGSSSEWCRSVQQTADDGYILGGDTDSYGVGDRDFWLVKVNANGNTLWTRTFGGSDYDGCLSVQQTTDGGYILGGRTWSYGAGLRDFWLVKTGSERPYDLTVYLNETGTSSVLRWMAPSECDYLVYSTRNTNHDGNPPGPDWTLEVTLPDVPAGRALWTDSDGPAAPYRNYVIVTSCP
jgi:hypothetical protein